MVLENFIVDAPIVWDRVGKKIFENPHVKQGRKMRVQITNAGIVEDLSGYTLALGWKHTVSGVDGLDVFEDNSEANVGIFEMAYTENLMTNLGNLKASLVLTSVEDMVVAESNDFYVKVDDSPFGADAEQGVGSYTRLAQILLNEEIRQEAYLRNEALVASIDDKFDAFIQTNIVQEEVAEVFNNLEETYAQEIVSVKQQLEQKSINVKANGAMGDGITDDTAALQDIFNNITVNTHIFFPPGVYIISSTLLIKNKNSITISGIGMNSKVLNVGKQSAIHFKSCEHLTIKDLAVFGNGGAYGLGASGLDGLVLENTHHVKLYNVSIWRHGGKGIYIHGGGWVYSFIACSISQNGDDGVNSFSPTSNGSDQNGNNLSIINCSIYNNGGCGIKWKAAGLNISGGVIEQNKKEGILLTNIGSTSSLYGVSIVGVYFESNYLEQIALKTVAGTAMYGISIEGCYIYSSHDAIGGAQTLIRVSGTYGSVYNFTLGKGNVYEIVGTTLLNYADLGTGVLSDSSTLHVDTNYRKEMIKNVGLAKLIVSRHSKFVSGKFNQSGFPFTNVNKSDNLIGLPTKKGVYALDINESTFIRNIKLFVETDTADTYSVVMKLKEVDLNNPVGGLIDLTNKPFTVNGGNKLLDWELPGLGGMLRKKQNTNLYLEVEILYLTNGTKAYVHDVNLELI